MVRGLKISPKSKLGNNRDHLISLKHQNTPHKKNLVARGIQTPTWSDPPMKGAILAIGLVVRIVIIWNSYKRKK